MTFELSTYRREIVDIVTALRWNEERLKPTLRGVQNQLQTAQAQFQAVNNEITLIREKLTTATAALAQERLTVQVLTRVMAAGKTFPNNVKVPGVSLKRGPGEEQGSEIKRRKNPKIIGSVNWSAFTGLLQAIKVAQPNDLVDYSILLRIKLLFPYSGCRYPYERFHLVQNSDFSYMGRREFKQLSDVISRLAEFPWMTAYRELYLYGTLGYEKPYLLAAIVCFLIQRGKNVVYSPDCRALLEKPVRYI